MRTSISAAEGRPLVLALMVASAMVASLSGRSAGSSELEISVRAAYDAKDGRWLRMELENRSSERISMTNSFLPWGSTFSTLLVAVVATDPIGPAPVIERNQVQEHPIGTEITIGPGETLRGNIDLNWQFPKLQQWTSRGDVVVFWSYGPRLRDGRHGERVGGFVVVPERVAVNTKGQRKD